MDLKDFKKKDEILSFLQEAGLPADETMSRKELDAMFVSAQEDGVFDEVEGEGEAIEGAEAPEETLEASEEETESLEKPAQVGGYEVVSPLKHNGTLYLAGESVDLPEDIAQGLVRDGVIK